MCSFKNLEEIEKTWKKIWKNEWQPCSLLSYNLKQFLKLFIFMLYQTGPGAMTPIQQTPNTPAFRRSIMETPATPNYLPPTTPVARTPQFRTPKTPSNPKHSYNRTPATPA